MAVWLRNFHNSGLTNIRQLGVARCCEQAIAALDVLYRRSGDASEVDSWHCDRRASQDTQGPAAAPLAEARLMQDRRHSAVQVCHLRHRKLHGWLRGVSAHPGPAAKSSCSSWTPQNLCIKPALLWLCTQAVSAGLLGRLTALAMSSATERPLRGTAGLSGCSCCQPSTSSRSREPSSPACAQHCSCSQVAGNAGLAACRSCERSGGGCGRAAHAQEAAG